MEEIIQRMLPMLIVFGVMLGIWFLLRSKASKLSSTSELESKIGRGSPIVLEFFSNT